MHTHSVNQTLTVLTPKLTERLHVVTQAQRALSALGYKVSSQNLRADVPAKRPQLILESGDVKLRRRMQDVVTAPYEGTELVIGRFMDVDLCWKQRLVAANDGKP